MYRLIDALRAVMFVLADASVTRVTKDEHIAENSDGEKVGPKAPNMHQ